jgi:hypothetical protein
MVLDEALRSGFPSYYTLTSPSAAIRWRARAYHFRKKTEVDAYKAIIFRILPSAPNTVQIEQETLGVFRNPQGEKVDLRSAEEEEAANLAAQLGIKL